jgi:hypothetical protein
MMLKRYLLKLLWIVTQFGIDPIRFLNAIRGFSLYMRDYYVFRKKHKGLIRFYPCLHERYAEAGDTKSEYFWQDLIVAQWIHQANPDRHVDVGSRTDGFIAHVASFREIEVFDVRPITTEIPGVTFRHANLMDPTFISTLQYENAADGVGREGYCDSLSCLHVLEHFGLGRYGDPIDPQGYQKGFANLASLLCPQARFYLSSPIGRERVEFNANWVFDPSTILSLAIDNGLSLERFAVYSQKSGFREIQQVDFSEIFSLLAAEEYNLGIFLFKKTLQMQSLDRGRGGL